MNARRLYLAATFAAGMLAVGTSYADNCAQQSCTIIVDVSDTNVVSAYPDALIPEKGKGKKIVFTINPNLPNTWKFVSGAVVFSNDVGPPDCPDKQFSNGTVTGGGKKYTMDNKNNCKKTFKYTVQVTNGTQSYTSPDPTIANQGEALRTR